MNPEEVIERLKTIFAFGISNCIADKIARDTTFAALEKQMPKKPINDKCENCGEDVRNWTGDDNFKYCPNCGQRADWSESE